VQQTTQQAEMSRSELQRAGFSEVRVFAQDPNSPGVTVALWRDPSGKQYVFRFRIDIRYGEYGPFNPGKKIAYDVDKDTITVDGVAVTGN